MASGRVLLRGGLAVAVVFGVGVAVPAAAGTFAAEAVPTVAPTSCSSVAADVAAATRVAAACGRRVEALNQRTERDQVFVDGTGTATLVASSVPQRIRRGDGSWADVSTSLVKGADGLWAPQASTADVRFSDGGSGPAAIWREAGRSLTLSWPAGALKKPRIDGDSAVYEGVYPGVNLHLIATVEGFRPVLEVRTPAAAANPALRSVRYRLGGDLRVVPVVDGGVAVLDPSGTVVASSPPAKMWDSSVRPATAGEVLPGVTPVWDSDRGGPAPANLPADLVSTARGAGAASASAPVGLALDGADLVLTPDESMLTGARVRLPMFIDPPLNKQRYKWFYSRNNNANWDVEGQAWVGKNPPCCGGDGTLFRSFFQFDISALHGSHVFSAEVQMVLDHSYSCGDTWVHLYRAGPTSGDSGSRVSWSSRPLGSGSPWLDSWAGHANESGGCGANQPDAAAVFDHSNVRTWVQSTADNPDTDAFAVGLCACNESDEFESTQDRWKKFHTGPTYLVATYNKPPNAPSAAPFSTTTDCYAQCTSPAVVRTTRPTLKANVSHAFNDQLKTVFEVRSAASDTATLVTGNAAAPTVTASPGLASWQVPASVLVNGTTYFWRARSTNLNNQAGGWMGWQTVTVDTTAPGVAAVASDQYPYRQWGQPVGTPGTFGLSGGGDVFDFSWQVDAGSSTTVAAAGTTTRTASVPYTPGTDMVHSMKVTARDAAGNIAGNTDHQFWVAPLANRCWHWALNESAGTVAADAGNTTASQPVCGPIGSSVAAMNGTLSGPVSFTAGYLGNAARFTGNGSGSRIATAGPVLDTTKSFTVMAWVRLGSGWTAGIAPYATVVSQDGTTSSRFALRFSTDANGGAGGWCFALRGSDTTENPQSVCATGTLGAGLPTVGEWVHVAGVYNAVAATIAVHVMGDELTCNGEKVSGPYTGGSWAAPGPLSIGAAKASTTVHSWIGDIDQVFAVPRVLSDAEICNQI